MVEFKSNNVRYEIRFKKYSDIGEKIEEGYTGEWKYIGDYDKRSYSQALTIGRLLKEKEDLYDVTLVTITEERELV